MKKRWKLDNKGMTLLEVIVAFAIFAIAATILITGFNGALKVMGNSEKIKNASQENTGKLNAVGASALEEFEGLKDSEITTIPADGSKTMLTFDEKYAVPGRFYVATSTEKTDMDMKMFQPDGEGMITPSVKVPNKGEEKEEPPKEPEVPENVSNKVFNGQSGTYADLPEGVTVGVIEDSQSFNSQKAGGESQLRQLYFKGTNTSIEVNMKSQLVFDLDFLYIAGDISFESEDGFILKNSNSPKKGNLKKTLVYFKKNTTKVGNTNGIPSGYYLLDVGEGGLNIFSMTADQFDACSINHKTITKQNQIVSDYVTNLFIGNQP